MNFYHKIKKQLGLKDAEAIEKQSRLLFNDLEKCDFKNLGVSDYNQRYINEHISDYKKSSWFLSHIFLLLLEQKKPLSELTVVDYGGGSGLVSYLAKNWG